MSIRHRFLVWVIVIASVLILSQVWHVVARDGDRIVIGAGAVVITSLLAVVAWLIVTAPPDAIRLPPLHSVAYLAVGTGWLAISAIIQPDQPFTAEARALAINESMNVVIASMVLSAAFGYAGLSPWWTAIVAWNPAAIGPLAVSPRVAAGGLVAAAVVVVIHAYLRRPV